jgi:hypothetical protein
MMRPLCEILAIAFVLIAVAACTSKKREDQFVQGQGENLLLISDYQAKVIPIQTLKEVGSKTKNSLRVTQKNVSVQNQTLETLPVVNISPELDLLKQVPFKAKPDTSGRYEIIYKITDSYLKVLKRAAKVDLDINEITYAEGPKDDGKWEVPLVGYPITGFYNVEKALNSDNEKTHNKIEANRFNMKDAMYFRADFNRPELFEALQKSNVLPVEYFDGEWYFAATVVDTKQKDSAAMGRSLHSAGDLENSSRVTFFRTENSMKALSLNIDPRLEKITERTKIKDYEYQVVFRIPVEHKYFGQSKQGNDSGMKETVDDSTPWEMRKSLQLDLVKANSPYIRLHSNESTLVELSVTDDYFSFVLQDEDRQIRVRYSFSRRKVDHKYEARLFHLSDFKSFGFFKAKRKSLFSPGSTLTDQTLTTFLTRFDPNKPEIKYYLSKNSSLRLNVVRTAVRAVKSWDKAFELAYEGTGIAKRPRVTFAISEKGLAALFPTDGSAPKVLAEELERKDLGDIRYNILNIFDSILADGPAGYGPSVKDPLNGEIISATSNVWTASTRNLIGLRLRGFIRERLRKTQKFELLSLDRILQDFEPEDNGGPSSPAPAAEGNVADHTQGNSDSYSLYLDRLLRSQMKDANALILKDSARLLQQSKYRMYARQQNINNAIPVSVIETNLEHFCKAEVEALEKIMSVSQTPIDRNNEVDLINRCVDKLEPLHLQNTLVHEMGHNFGLRHNFAASADPENFWTDDELAKHFAGLFPPSSSVRMDTTSIMEYQPDDEHLLVVPGKYDIAALRFGYAGAVEMADKSNIRKISNPAKSLNANFSATRGEVPRAFKFCTDDDVVLDVDAMCMRHDIGTTPLEALKNLIVRFYKSVAQQAHIYDRAYFADDEAFALSLFENYFLPARRYMEELRVRYMRQYGKSQMHFENMSMEEVELLVTRAQGSDKEKREISEYYAATKLAYQFLSDVAMTPGKYCHLDVAGTYQLIDMEELRKEIYAKAGKNVISCQDPQAKDFIKAKYGSDNVVAEVGQFTNAQRISQDPNALKSKAEYRGFGLVRIMAAYALMLKEPQSFEAYNNGIVASFMDIPLFREDFVHQITDRVINGMDTDTILSAVSDKSAADSIFREFTRRAGLLDGRNPNAIKVRTIHKLFAQEAEVNSLIFMLAKYGMILPTDSAETLRRLVPFDAMIARNNELAKANSVRFIDMGNGYFYGPRTKEATVANALSLAFETKAFLDKTAIYSHEDINKYYAEMIAMEPRLNTLNKVTSGEFMDIFENLGKKMTADVVSKDTDSAEALKLRNKFILSFLADENKFYNRMVQFENAGWQAPPKEIIDRTKAEPFVTSMVKNIDPEYWPSLEDRIQAKHAEADRILETKKFFESNSHEFEARQRMLHNLMFAIAATVND